MSRNKKEWYKKHRQYGPYSLDKSVSSTDPMAKAEGYQSAVWEVSCKKSKREYWHTGLCMFKKEDQWRFETTFIMEKPARQTMTNYEIHLYTICLDILEHQRFRTIDEAMDAMKISMDIAKNESRGKGR